GKNVHVTAGEISPEVRIAIAEAAKDSRVICFLGFGYDPDNVKKLGIRWRSLRGLSVFGSAYKLTPGDLQRASALFAEAGLSFSLQDDGMRCLEFLKNKYVLRR